MPSCQFPYVRWLRESLPWQWRLRAKGFLSWHWVCVCPRDSDTDVTEGVDDSPDDGANSTSTVNVRDVRDSTAGDKEDSDERKKRCFPGEFANQKQCKKHCHGRGTCSQNPLGWQCDCHKPSDTIKERDVEDSINDDATDDADDSDAGRKKYVNGTYKGPKKIVRSNVMEKVRNIW